MKYGLFLILIVWNIDAMLPQLCIEINEKKYLAEYHQSCKRDIELERNHYMPKTSEELNALFESYHASKYKNAFVSNITANIEGELKSRCKDGKKNVLDKYLDTMRVSFAIMNSFRKMDFCERFFFEFREDFNYWILEMEDLVKSEGSLFTRESLYLPYTVKCVDAILSKITCLMGKDSILEEYNRCCLE